MEETTGVKKKRKKDPTSITVELNVSIKQKQEITETLQDWAQTNSYTCEDKVNIDNNGKVILEFSGSFGVPIDQTAQNELHEKIINFLNEKRIDVNNFNFKVNYESEAENQPKMIKKNEEPIIVLPIPNEILVQDYIKKGKNLLALYKKYLNNPNEYFEILNTYISTNLQDVQNGFYLLVQTPQISMAYYYYMLLRIAKDNGLIDNNTYKSYEDALKKNPRYNEFENALRQNNTARKENHDPQKPHQHQNEFLPADVMQQELAEQLLTAEAILIKPHDKRSYEEIATVRNLIKSLGLQKLGDAYCKKIGSIISQEVFSNVFKRENDTEKANLYFSKLQKQQIKKLDSALKPPYEKEMEQEILEFVSNVWTTNKQTLHALFETIPKDSSKIRDLILSISALHTLSVMQYVQKKVPERKLYGQNKNAILENSEILNDILLKMQDEGVEVDNKTINALRNQRSPINENKQSYDNKRAGYMAQLEQTAKRFSKGNLVKMEAYTMTIENGTKLHVDFSTLKKISEVKHYSKNTNLLSYEDNQNGFSNLGEILNYVIPCYLNKKPLQIILTNNIDNYKFLKQLIILSSLFPEGMYIKMTQYAFNKYKEHSILFSHLKMLDGKEDKDGYYLVKIQDFPLIKSIIRTTFDKYENNLKKMERLPDANTWQLPDNSNLKLKVYELLQKDHKDGSTSKNIPDLQKALMCIYLHAVNSKFTPISEPAHINQVQDVNNSYYNPSKC